jgi:hypothetical protein
LNSIDGNNVAVTEAFLDRLAHKKGFTGAMRAAGWLKGESGALVFPGFDRHNGATAKERAATNRRVAKHRMCHAKPVTSVTIEALQKPLPDKSKSKNKTSSCKPLPLSGAGVGEHELFELTIAGGKPDVAGIVALYPRREGVMAACTAVHDHLRRGFEVDAIVAGTRAIAAVISQMPGGHLNKFVPSAEKFFRDRKWEDDPATWLRGAAANGTGEPREPYKPGGRKGTTLTLSSKPQTKQ